MIEFLWRRWHRLRWRPLPAVPPLRPVSWNAGDALAGAIRATRPRLVRILTENILPFWLPQCLDRTDGGYLLHHDALGAWRGPAPKHLIAQARTTWFFARMARDGGHPDMLAAAAHGFGFLENRMWDREQGGFFWSVSADGRWVEDAGKRMIGHVFATFAVTEYALVSGAPAAMARVGELARILESRFHDPAHGGYLSRCDRGWGIPEDRREAWSRKSVGDHLHVLEALAGLLAIADDRLTRDRLWEVILILTSTGVRQTVGSCVDQHRRDWTPLLDRHTAQVNYGHDIEAAWLVLDAGARLGVSSSLLGDWGRTLVATALRWGWDGRRGGLYHSGPLNGPADTRYKTWWAQAEALVSLLRLYLVTGDAALGRRYLDLLDWIEHRQVDWEHGEWHAIIHPDGRVSGDKAGNWKSPYHNGRAMLECLALLPADEGA